MSSSKRRHAARRNCALLALALAAGLVSAAPAGAETLTSAMSLAYRSNPNLNAERAGLRATDELVPQALSAWRPTFNATGQVESTWTHTVPGGSNTLTGGDVGLSVQQNLFSGFRRANGTKQAEASVRSGRASLANTEQQVLLQAVTAYMDVLQYSAIVRLRNQNIGVLDEQLRAARNRFEVGEVTRTDVSQAEARLRGAVSEYNFAESNLLSARATYRQVVGQEPKNLAPAKPARNIPGSLDAALSLGHRQHPAVISAIYGEEAAAFAVNVAEGALLPTLSVEGSVGYSINPTQQLDESSSASAMLQLNVPIYQGGGEYSEVRQAKEERNQALLQIDVARQQVRADIFSAWGVLKAATASIDSARSQVNAASVALTGVREEANVGQRTTLDVLNAEQELFDARVSLVVAERDQVVASYTLLAAIGRLNAEALGLAVDVYRPEVHYEQVRDKWTGLRTPSGQ